MDVKSRNGEKFEIFSNFLAHPVETPWTILTVLHQNVRRSMHEWDHPHVIFPLFAPHGGRWPPKGGKTRPDPGYARMQNMAWIGPRVAEKSLTEQTNKHTVKQIPHPSLYERMAGNKKTYSRINTSPIGSANGG